MAVEVKASPPCLSATEAGLDLWDFLRLQRLARQAADMHSDPSADAHISIYDANDDHPTDVTRLPGLNDEEEWSGVCGHHSRSHRTCTTTTTEEDLSNCIRNLSTKQT